MENSIDRSLQYTSEDDTTFYSAVGSTSKLAKTIHPVWIFDHGEDGEFPVEGAEVPSDTNGQAVSSARSPNTVMDGQNFSKIAKKTKNVEENALREVNGWIQPEWVPGSLSHKNNKIRLHLKRGDVVYVKAATREGATGTYWYLARIERIRGGQPDESKRNFLIRYVDRKVVQDKNGFRYRNYRMTEWVSFGYLVLDSAEARIKANLDNKEFLKENSVRPSEKNSVRPPVRSGRRNGNRKTGSKKRV